MQSFKTWLENTETITIPIFWFRQGDKYSYRIEGEDVVVSNSSPEQAANNAKKYYQRLNPNKNIFIKLIETDSQGVNLKTGETPANRMGQTLSPRMAQTPYNRMGQSLPDRMGQTPRHRMGQ